MFCGFDKQILTSAESTAPYEVRAVKMFLPMLNRTIKLDVHSSVLEKVIMHEMALKRFKHIEDGLDGSAWTEV